jgi:hypothetical protein
VIVGKVRNAVGERLPTFVRDLREMEFACLKNRDFKTVVKKKSNMAEASLWSTE